MKNSTTEEIDVFSILQSIKNGFVSFLSSIRRLIYFCLKNIRTVIVFCILGIAIAVGLFLLKKTVYTSELTISHNRLNNSECYTLIGGLARLIENSNTANIRTLSQKLGISVNEAQQIKKISSWSLNESLEKTYKDSAFIILPFKIEVKIYDPSILDNLQTGILNYLESNEFASKRKGLNQQYLEKYQAKIKSEIIAVDSLKQIVNKSIIPRGTGNGIILGEPINPINVYQAGLDLYKQQLKIDEQQQLNNSFEILVGFSPAIPSASVLLYIFWGGLISFVASMLWLFGMRVRESN